MKRFSAHTRTPSALDRQMQRLEAALGADLLDRSIKPPRLNSLGFRCSNKREIWRLRLLSELTGELFRRLLAGELEAAVVLLLEENRTSTSRHEFHRQRPNEDRSGRHRNCDGDWTILSRAPWVLNPPECPLRARLVDPMERDGFAH
jgi:hypothetical protein